MNDLLFDAPWWLLALPVIAGIALLVSGNARQNSRLLRAGAILIAVAIVWGLVSFLVDTPREKVVSRTKQIISAVDHRDWETVRSLLDANTSVLQYRNRDDIVAGGKATVEQQNVHGIHISGMNVEVTASTITVVLRLFSEQDATGGRPFPTDWKFNWHDVGQGWQLYDIEYLPSAELPARGIDQRLAGPR